MRVEQTPESWGPPGPRTWHRHVATVRSFLSGYRRRGWPARGPGADRRPAHGAPDDSKAIPLPELERLCSRRDLPLRERSLWRLPYDSAAWRQGVLRVAPPGAPPPASHPGSCAGRPAAVGPRCEVPHDTRGSLGEGGWIFTGRPPPTGSEQITSASNVAKSVVAGVDIRRLHGYSFSRSPERQ